MSPQPTIVDRRRRSVARGRAAAVALGLTLALTGSGVASARGGGSAHVAAERSARAAARLELRIGKLQREGYQQASCTLSGIRMVNLRTHRSVTVTY